MAFDDGSKLVQIVGGPLQYYLNYTTTNAYVECVFGGNILTITLANDSTTDTVSVSYNGATLKCELSAGESITLHTSGYASIYLRGTAGGGKVRVWGW